VGGKGEKIFLKLAGMGAGVRFSSVALIELAPVRRFNFKRARSCYLLEFRGFRF